MRNALYAKLQDLPVSFHDRWPSGQLLSRAVSDLGLIRRWLSFGLVLLVVNLIVIVVGFGILVSMNWMLGARVPRLLDPAVDRRLPLRGPLLRGVAAAARTRRATSPPRSRSRCTASACSRRSVAASTRSTTFRAQAESLRSTEIEKARLDRRHLAVDPRRARRRARRVPRARRAGSPSQGALTVGELVAFFATATVLALADRVDRVPARVHGRRAHRDRPVLRHPRQRERDHRPRGAGRDRAPAGASSSSTTCASATRTRPTGSATCSTASTSSLEPGETMALVGLTGSGKTTLTALTTRLYDVTGGSITLDGVDIRDAHPRGAAHAHRDGVRGRDAVQRLGARQRAARPAGARGRRARGACRGRAGARRGAAHRAGRLRRTTCPTASTRRSARRA